MRWMVLVVGMAMALPGGGAAAQVVPFARPDTRMESELRSAVLGHFQTVMGDWVAAVNAGEAERASDLYAEDALVHLGETAIGAEDVHGFLEGWLDDVTSLTFGLAQFDASSSLAHAVANVLVYRWDEGAGRTVEDRGVMILVLRKEGRDDWRIRSQTLLVEPARGP